MDSEEQQDVKVDSLESTNVIIAKKSYKFR